MSVSAESQQPESVAHSLQGYLREVTGGVQDEYCKVENSALQEIQELASLLNALSQLKCEAIHERAKVMQRNNLVKAYKGIAPRFMPLTSEFESQPHLSQRLESYVKVKNVTYLESLALTYAYIA